MIKYAIREESMKPIASKPTQRQMLPVIFEIVKMPGVDSSTTINTNVC